MVRIIVDDLRGPEIAAFLQAHLDQMREITPPDSVHALDLDALRRPEVTFWTALDGTTVVGCGALKALGGGHAEVKSMRTAPSHRGRGVASTVLLHMITEARAIGCSRLSLETGSTDFFAPARALYVRHGFEFCGPFADYTDDPHSVYLTRTL